MNDTKDTQQHPKVEIAVENFGPIAEADIDLRPLTVFVGPSNTGKNVFCYVVVCIARYLRRICSISFGRPCRSPLSFHSPRTSEKIPLITRF